MTESAGIEGFMSAVTPGESIHNISLTFLQTLVIDNSAAPHAFLAAGSTAHFLVPPTRCRACHRCRGPG